MYTGPTPMPVRGGPRTTSLIDDLTSETFGSIVGIFGDAAPPIFQHDPKRGHNKFV